MIYIAGIDGGASKTHCMIGDADGNVLAEGFSAGSNHQAVGLEKAGEAIQSALAEASGKLGVKERDIRFTVLGLAGADLEPDFAALNEVCGRILPPGSYQVINDTWIGLRAGIPENWGIVTNCGTGGSCAGRNKDGEEVRLRNLSFELGNFGGGVDIAKMALHHAFRSEEKSGSTTALEQEIPKVAGVNSLDELISNVLSMNFDPEVFYAVPILVGELACLGDKVSQDILIKVGHEMGEIAGGVARRLHMEDQRFKVTLVGSVFKSECPVLIDEYTTTLHRAAPYAQIGLASQPSAMGAFSLACEAYRRKF